MRELPLKGTIRDIAFPRLLAYLNRNRETGTLIVRTPVFTKKVYLVKGDAVFASSTYEDDRLGEMLIKAEKITMEQYDTSVRLLKQTGKRQGAILVELGYLTPKDLFWGVKYQVREIICSLFLIEDAECEFTRGEIPQQEVITLKMSMGNLIYEGVKRIDNWTRIRNEMPDAATVFKLSSDPVTLFQDVELGALDRKMLSLIDGTKTIKELIDNAWTGSFEGMKILYVLWSLGVIEEKKTPTGKAEQTVPVEEILKPAAEDTRSFLKRVDDVYSKLSTISPSRLLEIEKGADEKTIKKNYYKLAKEFHPDRYLESPDPSVKDKLTSIVEALRQAYTSLSEKKAKGTQGQRGKSLSSGTEFFGKGVAAFKKNRAKEAVDYFRSAIKAEPKNPKYWSHLSLALSKTELLKEAESALLEAIRLEPDNANHYANLGLILVRRGMKKEAYNMFSKALHIDPGNTKAKKAVEKMKT